MAPELVVTPGGYRLRDMVHKIGADLRLRILTGRLQGVDASDKSVADYGSIPRDGANPALTPGYALPPGIDTPEGSEPAPPFGRGWATFAHWTNEGSVPISSFRATWRVPPEPATRSGQTIFLFLAMQDSIPMTLLPALQWGASAAGGGDYWSVANWYVGGTTGAVFYGELMPVNVGDELTGFITLANRRREHCDYRCGFEGLGDVDLPVYGVRQLSRCGEILAAYGIKQCSDYPDASAASFRDLEIVTGFTRPALAWNPVNAITDCGQHVVVLSDANPGGEIDVHFRPSEVAAATEAVPEEGEEVAPVAAEVTDVTPEPVAEAAEVEAAAPSPEPVLPKAEEETAPEEGERLPLVAAAIEAEPVSAIVEPELVMESAGPQEGEGAPSVEPIEEAPEPGAAEPAPVSLAAAAEAATIRTQVTEQPLTPATLPVSPNIGHLVEVTIHNHSPADSASAVLEARLAALEATVAAFAQLVSSGGQSERSPSDNGDVSARLERLARLKENGALTDDEFAAAKAQLLGQAAGGDGLNASPEVVLR